MLPNFFHDEILSLGIFLDLFCMLFCLVILLNALESDDKIGD